MKRRREFSLEKDDSRLHGYIVKSGEKELRLMGGERGCAALAVWEFNRRYPEWDWHWEEEK